MKIVLCYPVEKRHYQQISDVAPTAELVDAGQKHIAREILRADIFCGHAKVPIDWAGVVREGRLKWIQSSAAGLDHCLVPPVIESEIVVTSASGVLADQVAEHAMALVLALTRSMNVFFRAQQVREFIRRPTLDLHGCTAGIVGLGGVGRRIAEVVSPFKTRILAVDTFPFDKPKQVEALWPAERLPELLAEVDVLFLSAPLTTATRGMIDRRAFARMKKGALLVNVARGSLVVEADLVEALRNGHLGGSALDVTEEEPLPASSPLWDIGNVIITPHVGGQSRLRIDQMTDFFCDNLHRFIQGQPLMNFVDKELGYPRRMPQS
jgi:phosphoglycerate dehydrogenase-like enzyme